MKASRTPLPPPAPPAPSSKRTVLYVLLGFFGLALVSVGFVVFALQYLFQRTSGVSLIPSSDEIALIEIEGPIYQSDDVVRRIKQFAKGSKRALILRLNSPGGGVAPSQEIYSEILSARENEKIVVASMSSLAASGAYYIAAACDLIVANPGTVTGSIGVIAEFPDASVLLRKVGLNFETIKSGKFKDSGSFSRPMNPQDRAYLQETINDVFGQFLDSVVEGRDAAFRDRLAQVSGRKPEQVTGGEVRAHATRYADGRILTGKKALELGFVDRLGNYHDAVRATADLAGIKGEPKVRPDRSIRVERYLKNLLPFSWVGEAANGFKLSYRAF